MRAGELSSADFFLRFLILQYYILIIITLLKFNPSLETHALLFGLHWRLHFHHAHLAVFLVLLVWIVAGAVSHLEQRCWLVDAFLEEGSFVYACCLLYLHPLEERSDIREFLGDCSQEIVAESVYLSVHELAKGCCDFYVELCVEQ